MTRKTTDTEIAGAAEPSSVFSPGLRGTTFGVLLSVGAVAFESLGVATILPTAADDLGGLGSYGWGLSALMLANIVGAVVAGADIDRRGTVRAALLGSLIFALGCLAAGLAPNWGSFVAARALQGLGVGAIMAYAYSLVGLAYPPRLQAVMYAFLSSAWTIPSLVGPLAAGLLVSVADWRVVFWLVAPAVLALLPLVLPGARRAGLASSVATSTPVPGPRRTVWFSVLLAAATGIVLAGLETKNPKGVIALVGVGAVVALLALRRLTPAGTLRAARGVPAGVGVRFMLCAVYFGSEAFLPLGLTHVHGLDVTLAGLALAAGALAWTAGSFIQARLDTARPGTRGRSVRWGFAVLLVGEIATGLTVANSNTWPGWAVVGWTIAGVGMGIAFNASTSATMSATSAETSGSTSAGLQLAQTLSTAVVAGVGGALIAASGTAPRGFGAVFAVTAVLGLIGVLLAGRVDPARVDRT